MVSCLRDSGLFSDEEMKIISKNIEEKQNTVLLEGELWEKINQAFSSEAGKALIDEFDKDQEDALIRMSKEFLEEAKQTERYQTDEAYRKFIDSPTTVAYILDAHNKFGNSEHTRTFFLDGDYEKNNDTIPRIGDDPEKFLENYIEFRRFVAKKSGSTDNSAIDRMYRTTEENLDSKYSEIWPKESREEEANRKANNPAEETENYEENQRTENLTENNKKFVEESEAEDIYTPFTYVPKDEKDEENSPDLITGWPTRNKEDKHPLFDLLNMGERPLSPDGLIFTTLPKDVPEEDIETLDASICLNFWSRYWQNVHLSIG